MNYRTIQIACLVGLLSILSGCVSTYKAAEDGVAGYRELRVEKDLYNVEYTEASRISWEQLRQFALRRAAELARKNGYAAFDVLEKDEKTVFLKTDVNQITVTTPGILASDPAVSTPYQLDGRVEGKRVVLKVRFVND